MKIAILSCFYPYRGGIAQFNANLFMELGKEHDVRAFNFKRQYPEFLFPGKTQFVTEQDEAVSIESTALLDTANPFTYISTANEIASWGPDILIVRYWMSYFAPSLGYIVRRMPKSCKTIGILDNVIPHERHFFDKPLTKYFLGGLDGCVTLCDELVKDLLDIKPDAVHTTLPHPIYTHFGEKLAREDAEALLGLQSGKKNLLFFGLIREYKGLDILLRAFNTLDDSYQLIIAGEPYGSFDKYQQIIDESPFKNNIHLFPDYIRDSEVKRFFSAADVTVLPYRSATQSGISSISNHFEVPMIVTDVGGLKETIGQRGTGIVCEKAEPENVAAAIKEYFASGTARQGFTDCIRKENQRLSWAKFCKDLLAFASTLK